MARARDTVAGVDEKAACPGAKDTSDEVPSGLKVRLGFGVAPSDSWSECVESSVGPDSDSV